MRSTSPEQQASGTVQSAPALQRTLSEVNNLRMDMIHTESHFHFAKMYLLSHFSDPIHQFGNIPIYSTEFREPRLRNRSRMDRDARIRTISINKFFTGTVVSMQFE